jgi:SAM-dependent methyltransferase
VAEPAGERPDPDSAVHENYATNANLNARRGLLSYTVTPPTPQPNVVDLLDWPDDARVLDIGCGDGVWTAVAAQRTPRGPVVGLDFSLGMLHALADRSRDVLRVQGDANGLPIRSGSVDVVLAMWMLYHVDRHRAIEECRRVLRPGGKLIAATNESSFLPGLDDFLQQAASEVAGRQLDEWLGTLAFDLETGESWLTPHFANVERVVNETPFEVPDATPLLAYIDSVRGPTIARQGDDFDFDAFRSLVEAELDRRLESGPIRFDRRIAFFVASN